MREKERRRIEEVGGESEFMTHRSQGNRLQLGQPVKGNVTRVIPARSQIMFVLSNGNTVNPARVLKFRSPFTSEGWNLHFPS